MKFTTEGVTAWTSQANLGSPRLTLVKPPRAQALTSSATSAAQAFSAAEMRHHFAIWKLAPAEPSNRHLELYFCLRCKWAFRVDGRRGLITPLDKDGNAVEGVAAGERLATFASGPCPVFANLTPHSRLTERLTLMDRLRARLSAPVFAVCRAMVATFWRK